MRITIIHEGINAKYTLPNATGIITDSLPSGEFPTPKIDKMRRRVENTYEIALRTNKLDATIFVYLTFLFWLDKIIILFTPPFIKKVCCLIRKS
jgi:hypothetical protein